MLSPHFSSSTLKTVVLMEAFGRIVTFCSLRLQVMGWIKVQSLPSGQHTAVVPPARALHVVFPAQQKLLGRMLGHVTWSASQESARPNIR